MFTLFDFHQDMLNSRYQGRGFADWFIQDDGFPNDPQAGFPGNYFLNPALNRAYDNVWANVAAQVVNRVGGYDPRNLLGCPRIDAGPMPPRAGNVSMNSGKLAAALGYEAVAMTDHDSLTGAVRFQEPCWAWKIPPRYFSGNCEPV